MRNIIIATIILSVAFCSCKKIEGNGDVITETYTINDYFQEVTNETAFDVEVVFSNENKVEITGESNIIEKLSVNVKHKKLIIDKVRNKYRLRSTQPVNIKIYMKRNDYMYFSNYGSCDLTVYSPLARKIKLDNTGSGDLYVFDCEHEAVEVLNSGSGDIVVTGVAGEVYIKNSGSGDVDCYHLTSQYVEIHSSGTGRTEAYATDEADVWESGSGEVYVYGTERVRYHYEYDDDDDK